MKNCKKITKQYLLPKFLFYFILPKVKGNSDFWRVKNTRMGTALEFAGGQIYGKIGRGLITILTTQHIINKKADTIVFSSKYALLQFLQSSNGGGYAELEGQIKGIKSTTITVATKKKQYSFKIVDSVQRKGLELHFKLSKEFIKYLLDQTPQPVSADKMNLKGFSFDFDLSKIAANNQLISWGLRTNIEGRLSLIKQAMGVKYANSTFLSIITRKSKRFCENVKQVLDEHLEAFEKRKKRRTVASHEQLKNIASFIRKEPSQTDMMAFTEHLKRLRS